MNDKKGDGEMEGTCENDEICNTDGMCYFCVNSKDLTATDPGCNALNPHCKAADDAGGTTCVCTTASDTVCDASTSSVCTSEACKCGVDEDCSATTATPKCSEPSSVPDTPTKGSTTATCQVIYIVLILLFRYAI